MKKGFDNKKYIELQAEAVNKKIKEHSKLYMEIGGKLFDDFHASRVLPGFKANSKIEILKKLKDKLEVIFCINANDIERHKIRADYGITYDVEIIRLIDALQNEGILVNSVVITLFEGQANAEIFRKTLERRGIKTYIHTYTKGYPTDVDIIVSDEGYGANSYIETTRPLVVVTAPGAASGKLATCLSQVYHEYKRGIKTGYAKFETFPIWNVPIKHPVNVAYEASTADINDKNMIDPFHMENYNKISVNYNRDIEVFPILKNILEKITGECIYKSPTDMGINMTGFAIDDDEKIKIAAREEIIRRYYKSLNEYKLGLVDEDVPKRIKILMNELNINFDERKVISKALEKYLNTNYPSIALKLSNGKIITGRNTDILTSGASVILNALKSLAKIDDKVLLISPVVLEPMLKLKRELYGKNTLLNLQDVLTGLSISSATNPIIEIVLNKLSKLCDTDAHSSHIVSNQDEEAFRTLGIYLTTEVDYFNNSLKN